MYDEQIFKQLNKSLNNLSIVDTYRAYAGRDNLRFEYTHVADSNYRIDPARSNIIDTYVLTRQYDTNIRQFLNGALQVLPLPQSNDELFRNYGSEINKIKSISDEVIYHPVKYKVLFGKEANEDLQVIFKIVRNKDLVVNDNELKADVINAINEFFAIENWDFGETFYFQELSAYIINKLTPKLVSVVIVPRQGSQAFGSLFEIRSEPDEIFISGASVADVEIIKEITAVQIQASGQVITSSTSNTSGNATVSARVSSTNNTTIVNSNNSSSSSSSSGSNNSSGGGYSY